MTSFKNYATGLVLAISFLAANVQADTVTSKSFEYGMSTADATGWSVASLYTSANNNSNYINPTKNGSGVYQTVGTTWNAVSNTLASANWGGVYEGNRSTWTAGGSQYGDWVAAAYDNDSKVENGFYAFKYSFAAKDPLDTSVSGNLNLALAADDYITAIYANDTLIYSSEIKKNGIAPSTWTDELSNLGFTVDLTAGGLLDLIFVVHNTNLAGSSTVNPMGLYAYGTLSTNVEMKTQTPEPATLAVLGLGLAGLGIARRRMRK